MATTITILASDPESRPERADPAIDAVRDKFKKLPRERHLHRAPSVEDVSGTLKEFNSPTAAERADRVQIIGHGTAGNLALGFFWTGAYRGKGLSQMLDSNPLIHMLLAGMVKRDSELLVLGCSVGEDNEDEPSMVADGPTLLFDLARMLGCTVGAPADVISADDFDENGEFMRRGCLWRVKGFEFFPPEVERKVHEKIRDPSPPPLKITGLEWAPILGERADRLKDVAVPDEWSHELPDMFDQEIRITSPVLALPEIVCTANWKGQPATAEVIGNFRILRVKCKEDVYHFAASQGRVREVRQLARKMLEPAFRSPALP